MHQKTTDNAQVYSACIEEKEKEVDQNTSFAMKINMSGYYTNAEITKPAPSKCTLFLILKILMLLNLKISFK